MPGDSDEIAVVVVAYGAEDLLRESLTPVAGAFETYVVDNSASETVREVSRQFGARYLRPARNVGFAAGVNTALTKIELPRDVLLLNPDARITADRVRQLHRKLHDGGPRVAAVAPRLRRFDGSIERTSWPIPSPMLSIANAAGIAKRLRWRTFLSGAVLLLSGEALEDVGPFDARFFLYAEESDWQLRALRRGWSVAEVGDVEAQHVGAGTSSDPELRERLFHASAEIFVRKWYGSWGWSVFRIGSILTAARRAFWSRGGDRRRELRTLRRYLTGPARALPPWARALGP